MTDDRSRIDPRRREFLTAGARWAAAGVLVGGTIWGVRRGADANCQKVSPCGACPVLEEGCGLPKAADWRRRTTQEGAVDA